MKKRYFVMSETNKWSDADFVAYVYSCGCVYLLKKNGKYEKYNNIDLKWLTETCSESYEEIMEEELVFYM